MPTAPRAPASGVKVAPARLAPASDKTTREVIPPWHVIQDKLAKKKADAGLAADIVPADQAARQALAAQEAANEQWMPSSDASGVSEAPPSSRVRVSGTGHAASAHSPEDSAESEAQEGVESNLTFKVYTLAELERRSDAPVSMRMSRANFDNTGSRGGAHWLRVYAALCAFGAASLAWWRTQGERPNPKVALRKPFDVLGDELQVAVEAQDWRKYGVTTGIIVGATLTLLFAVLTAAELTDDLKPGAGARLATTETSLPSTRSAPALPPVVASPNALAAPVAPAPQLAQPAQPVTSVGEIDDPEPATPAPATARRPVRKNAKPSTKSNKLGYRNADAIFNP